MATGRNAKGRKSIQLDELQRLVEQEAIKIVAVTNPDPLGYKMSSARRRSPGTRRAH